MIEYTDRSVDSQKVAYAATALQGATKKHKASKTPLVKCSNCGKRGRIRSKCTGTRIAQLVPFRSCVPNPGEVQRGDGGFGSTGKPQYWVCLKKLRRTTAQPMVLHDLLDFVICGEFIMVLVFHIFPQDRLLSDGPTKP
ncbi:uncharacterized protein LOC126053020 isoform X3 [Accipiter gentilis]|uniref:uncharacterized protein LOC126053020 isoform X3 n=1 Tax=Astur gentilis TaxID=8957 RepID=UPI0021109F23|nr:uncharacterized protein LOC126053020 isoform X3 [Accipiter gentilis]